MHQKKLHFRTKIQENFHRKSQLLFLNRIRFFQFLYFQLFYSFHHKVWMVGTKINELRMTMTSPRVTINVIVSGWPAPKPVKKANISLFIVLKKKKLCYCRIHRFLGSKVISLVKRTSSLIDKIFNTVKPLVSIKNWNL